jgi:DNA polymerase
VHLWTPDPFEDNPIPEPLKIALIEQRYLVEAHNSFFERCIWRHIMVNRYNWPKIHPSQWRCSAALAAYHALPRSLEGVGLALDLEKKKDIEGKRIMLKLSKPRKPTKNNKAKWHCDPKDYETLHQYCIDDVKSEAAISTVLNQLPANELRIWQLDQKINSRGIYCDIKTVKAAIKILNTLEQKANKKIKRISNGAINKYSEVAKILTYARAKGVDLKDTQKPTLEKILKTKLPDDVRKIIKIRLTMAKASTKKYQAMLNRASKDNRIRETLFYYGGHTGRWSGIKIQPHNYFWAKVSDFNKGFIKNKDIENIEKAVKLVRSGNIKSIRDTFGNPMNVLASILRGMLCSAPGKKLIAADLSGIEYRTLMWLVNQKNALRFINNGEDLYKVLATEIYDIELDDVKSDQREIGKRGILGLGFQMGWPRFKFDLKEKFDIDISEDLAKKTVNTYRSTYKRVVKFWKAVERAAIKCVQTKEEVKCGKVTFRREDNFLTCELPSGRKLYYYDPQLRVNKRFQNVQLTYMGLQSQTYKWVRLDTYGGKLTENIDQAIAADLLRNGMLNCEDAGYKTVLTVHDEIVSEVDKDFGSVAEMEKLMCQLPAWANGLPIAAEGWQGKRFRK